MIRRFIKAAPAAAASAALVVGTSVHAQATSVMDTITDQLDTATENAVAVAAALTGLAIVVWAALRLYSMFQGKGR